MMKLICKTGTAAVAVGAVLLGMNFLGFVPSTHAAGERQPAYVQDASQLQLVLGRAPDTALPLGNTADGDGALASVTTGAWNSAFGLQALTNDTTGYINTAVGVHSLFQNTQGTHNVASGGLALFANTTGIGNVGMGYGALYTNATGMANTAYGALAGLVTTGQLNVLLGGGAGINITTGNENLAVGTLAGRNLTSGNNNIDIGNPGEAGESNTIRIGDESIHTSVYLAGTGPATPDFPNEIVLVDPVTGRLGSSPSTGALGGLGAVLFDFNSGTITIGVGGAVPFNQPAFIGSGTAISKTNNTTFMLNANGVYRVSYTLRTGALSLLANVQVQVNGVGVGPTAALAVAGTSLSDQVTFFANAGSTVQLVVGGVALTLGTGDNATINIDKLQ